MRGRQGQRRVSLKDRRELKILIGWGGNSTQGSGEMKIQKEGRN